MTVKIIAEIGSVHDGSLGNALKLIETAAQCGANTVKFQTHIPNAEMIPNAPSPPFFSGESRLAYFTRTGFGVEQWRQLKSHCDSQKVEFLSSPFSNEAVDLLEDVGVRMYKVASGEVTNLPLLEKIAKTGKPILLSSGMSSWPELDRAMETIRAHHDNVTIMQCTSEYPCALEHAGLNVIAEMKARYNVPVGFSDHTFGPWAIFAAIALGASVVEKHLTFSRKMYGSDAPYATEPQEFAELVKGVRSIETILSHAVDKSDLSGMKEMKHVFEKSIVALRDLPADTVLQAEMIGCKKPGTGIPASEFRSLVGRRLRHHIKAETLLRYEDLEE